MAEASGKRKICSCLIAALNLASFLKLGCSSTRVDTAVSTPSPVSAGIITRFKKPDVEARPMQPGGGMPGMEAPSSQESGDYGLTGIEFMPYAETILVQ